MRPDLIHPDDLGLCDCAGCGSELLGERTAGRFERGEVVSHVTPPPRVAGRIRDRPYCRWCYDGPPASRGRGGVRLGKDVPADGTGYSWDDAVRAAEADR